MTEECIKYAIGTYCSQTRHSKFFLPLAQKKSAELTYTDILFAVQPIHRLTYSIGFSNGFPPPSQPLIDNGDRAAKPTLGPRVKTQSAGEGGEVRSADFAQTLCMVVTWGANRESAIRS